MKPYPKNRTYVIFPALTATAHLKTKKSLALHRLDKKSVIWDYDERDPILEKFRKISAIKLLTHDQALKETSKETWQKPEELTKLKLSARP